jgi:tRNA-splicing ligase RtcB
MVHSGSRGIGPAIRDHHLAQGEDVGGGLRALDATGDQGARYLSDAAWARRFADASRRAMVEEAGKVIEAVLGARLCWETVITTDHNHVSLERHGICHYQLSTSTVREGARTGWKLNSSIDRVLSLESR